MPVSSATVKATHSNWDRSRGRDTAALRFSNDSIAVLAASARLAADSDAAMAGYQAALDLDPADVKKAIEISAYGGFLVAQQAAKRMIPAGEGAIFFTGASASVKGTFIQERSATATGFP